MWTAAVFGIGGLVLATVTRCTGDRDDAGNRYRLARRSILLLLVGIAVIVLYIAQHVSGGGYLHPRYAFPVLASVATLLVVGLDRILPRILPMVLLVGMALWTLFELPVGIDPSDSSRPRDGNRLAPAALRILPGSECVANLHRAVDRRGIRDRRGGHRRRCCSPAGRGGSNSTTSSPASARRESLRAESRRGRQPSRPPASQMWLS